MTRAPDTAAQPRVWQAVLAGGLSAAFPDSDFVLGYVSDLAYLQGHRGVTHSVLLLPLWALLLAALMPRLLRARQAGWRAFYGVACGGIAIHILGDLITQFGTMILAPLSDRRFGWGTTFIIDLPLTGLLLAGLVVSALMPRSRLPSLAALLAMVAWVGVGALGKAEALDAARQHARDAGIEARSIDAIPRPASPFNWTAVIDDGERFHVAHINTRRQAVALASPEDGFLARLSSHYRPVTHAQWMVRARFGDADDAVFARRAWHAPDLAVFRWFAQFPVLESVVHIAGARCAAFRDLRFETPGRDGTPFRYGMCESPAGWQRVTLSGAGVAPPSR